LGFSPDFCMLRGMETPDQLRELFRMQKALNERIGVRTAGMSKEGKIKWISPTRSASRHALGRKAT